MDSQIPHPAYRALRAAGVLSDRAADARLALEHCTLCPRSCFADRIDDPKSAACMTGGLPRVAAAHPHRGEEAAISGTRGSGAIFFASCNMRCVFCKNWEISWERAGEETPIPVLADRMLALQAAGCHNINLISPSHVIPAIVEAVTLAAEDGLSIPLIYNTGGYDAPAGLRLMDGLVDIYLPDVKTLDGLAARKLARVPGYPDAVAAAIVEMHRQVGPLNLDDDGIARRGLLVRHLVMPGDAAHTEAVLRFLAEEIGPGTAVNVMGQYEPCHRAALYPDIDRPVADEAVDAARERASALGLRLVT